MRKNHEEIWSGCLRLIKDNIPETLYSIWFEPIEPMNLTGDILTIRVPSTFFYEYIEANFIDLLSMSIRKVLGTEAKLEYSIVVEKNNTKGKDLTVKYPGNTGKNLSNNPIPARIKAGEEFKSPFIIPGLKKVSIDPRLNFNYNFDNFIEGKCNEIAIAAGKEVVERPGKTSFNPFFLYGGPGMGKTHLAQAIGIGVKEKYPEKTVLYISANLFENQFTRASLNNNRNDFMHFYQMIDVLIIDDVHEFAGKKGTQDSFFHIFNHLHQNGKQIIMTCDRPPAELEGLNSRLISRFKWALTAQIDKPDYETRVKILQKKAYNDGINLPDDVRNYLAKNITGSVRELEGAFISLIARSTLIKKELTLETAVSMVDNLVKKTKKDINIASIQETVCEYFDMDKNLLKAKNRKREIVQARQISMFFCKKYTKFSLATIGAETGGKNHATVLHSYKTVLNLAETDKTFKMYINDIEKKLGVEL